MAGDYLSFIYLEPGGDVSENSMENNNDILKTEWFKSNILSLGYTLTGKVHNNFIIRYITA